MLVLTRRPGETLMIGSDVTVTVIAVSGQQVRLGVTAPRELKVLRAELREMDSAVHAYPVRTQ